MVEQSYKRIINFRVIFFLFVLGLFCVYISYKMLISLYFSVALIIPIVFCILLFFKKRYIMFALSIVFFSFLVIFPYVYLLKYTDTSFDNLGKVYLTGKITSINKIQENFCYITIDNVCVFMQDGESQELNGKLSLSVSIDEELKVGLYDRIAFTSKIYGMNILDENNEIESFYLKNNIRYGTNVKASQLIYLKSDINAIESFREYNRLLLVEGFGERMGHLAFTSLYGDTNYTERELLNEFKYSGVAHIFSVSGIHVSLIALLITFILDKLKVNKKVNFFIITIMLFFFCMLCNFNSPVIRSSIMVLVSILAGIYFRKYDALNSTSISGCILLALNPLNVFDVGFQMTFLSILGISMFSNIFKNIKIKNNIIKNIFFSMVTSLSAQLALIPIFANVYGFISTWSLLANLVIIPLFSLFYTMLFLINLIVLIMPFLNFLYIFPKATLYIIVFLNGQVNLLPYNIVYMPKVNIYLVFLYYINMFVVSKYFVMKWKYKSIIAMCLIGIVIGGVVINCLPRRSKENSMVFYPSSSYALGTLLTTKNNKFYLIEPNLNYSYEIAQMLTNMKIYSLAGIIMFDSAFIANAKDVYSDFYNFNPTFYASTTNSYAQYLDEVGADVSILENQEKIVIDNYFSLKYFVEEGQTLSILIQINTFTFALFDGDFEFNNLYKQFLHNNFNFTLDCARILGVSQREDESYNWRDELKCDKFVFDSENIVLLEKIGA